MTKFQIALSLLRDNEINVNDEGFIDKAALPIGELGQSFVDCLEEMTMDEESETYYTIIGNMLTKIDI